MYKNKLTNGKEQFKAQVQQQMPNRPMPQPGECIIPNSADNSTLVPGGGVKLRGHNLQFNEADAEQGIFLVADDQTRTRIEVVLHNTPRELIFLVPNTLTSGEYTLEVRVRYGNDNIRTGILESPLNVP